ncbi:hypothetical protein CCMA1212_009143 [Trichoderma ghanense]|uniref:Uncharacterized protein n=1 Tax=Trichoderma ghanense TaxID=65468 RepID=A0ABY2GTJ8_9HYPO
MLTVRMIVAFVVHLSALDDVLPQDRGHVFGVLNGGLDAGSRVEGAILLEALSDLGLGSGEDVDVAWSSQPR